MKKIALFSCLLLSFCLGACSDNDTDGVMSIELACPRPAQTAKDNVVTIKWDAIAKTEGYAYKMDDESEYTFVGADVLSYTAKMKNGTHVFMIYAVGNNEHTTDSAIRTFEFELNYDATLPMPMPAISTEEATATVTWEAVPRATGYAYKFDDQTDFTKVGADVLTCSGQFTSGTHTFTIYALGDGVDSEDSEKNTVEFDILDTSVGYFLKKTSGKIIQLTEEPAKVFTARFECAKMDAFYILIDGVKYGFMAYTGNGGIGWVNNEFAAVPFYNGLNYYVRESLGRMAPAAAEGEEVNNFYVNMENDCTVEMRIDCNQAEPRYRMTLINDDPSIVLAQYFDLMIYGGDWPNYKPGTGFEKTVVAGIDGTDPGEKDGAGTGTKLGATLTSSTAAGVEAYLENRNLTGWSAEYIYEFPGCIRLCNTSPATAQGVLVTPKLSALTGAATVTVTFDGLRFASTGDITVEVKNAGTISSAKVNADGKTMTDIAVEAGGKSFNITSSHGTSYANGDIKSWSNFTFVIEGATAETQISWTSDVGKQGRYMLDNIVVKK